MGVTDRRLYWVIIVKWRDFWVAGKLESMGFEPVRENGKILPRPPSRARSWCRQRSILEAGAMAAPSINLLMNYTVQTTRTPGFGQNF